MGAFRMRDAIQEKYGQTPDEAMPRLIVEFKTPMAVAQHLGVYPNAVRNWLERNNYVCVHEHRWERKPEAESA